MIEQISKMNRILEYSISILFFILIVIILWSLNKGFDLSDEGLYLALSDPNVQNFDGQFNYDLFFKLFYNITSYNFDIVGLRIIKLFLLFVIYILYQNIFKFFKIDYFGKIFVGIGLISSYSVLGQSLSYNTISFFLMSVFNFVLFRHIFIKKSLLNYSLLGILSSLIFFSKSTVGLLILVISIFLIFLELVFHSKKVGVKYSFIIFLMSFILIQLFFQTVLEHYSFFQVIRNGMELSEYENSYSKFSIIKSPLAAVKWTLCLLLIGFFISKNLKIKNSLLNNLLYLSLIIILLFFFIYFHKNLFTFRFWEYLIPVFTLIIVGFFIDRRKNFNFFGRYEIFILFSFFIPYIISFGSNYYFFKSSSMYVFFWFLTLVILRSLSPVKKNYNDFYFLLILSIIIFFKVFFNVLIQPYNQPSILTKLVEFKYSNNRSIMLEKSQAKYLIDLRNVFDEFIPIGAKVTGLYQMPGDIFLAGRQNFYNPCIWDSNQYDFYKRKAIERGVFINEQYFLVNSVLDFYELESNNFVVLDSVSHYTGSTKYLIKANF